MTHDKIEISDMVQHKIVSLVASHDVLREKTIFKGGDLYDFYYCIAENILPKAWENYLKYWQQFNRPVPPDKVINRFRYLESDYRRSWKKDQLAEYIPYTENFDVIYPYLLEYLDSIW